MKKLLGMALLILMSVCVAADLKDPCYAPCNPDMEVFCEDVLPCQNFDCYCDMNDEFDGYQLGPAAIQSTNDGFYGTCKWREVPEFTTIGAGIALVGAGIVVFKKRKI